MTKKSKLFPKRRRSRLGPTRYVPRCKRKHCLTPLSHGNHTGLCEGCKEEVRAFLGIR